MLLIVCALFAIASAECTNNVTIRQNNLKWDPAGHWIWLASPAFGNARLFLAYAPTAPNRWVAIDSPLYNFDYTLQGLFPNGTSMSRFSGELTRDPVIGCISWSLSVIVLDKNLKAIGMTIWTGNKEMLTYETAHVTNMRGLVYFDGLSYPTRLTGWATSEPNQPDLVLGPFPTETQVRTVHFVQGASASQFMCSLWLLLCLIAAQLQM